MTRSGFACNRAFRQIRCALRYNVLRPTEPRSEFGVRRNFRINTRIQRHRGGFVAGGAVACW